MTEIYAMMVLGYVQNHFLEKYTNNLDKHQIGHPSEFRNQTVQCLRQNSFEECGMV